MVPGGNMRLDPEVFLAQVWDKSNQAVKLLLVQMFSLFPAV